MERTRTIRRRLMSVTLLTSAAGIALTCAALIVHEYLSSRAQAREQLHTLARVIATNSTAALAFDDAVGAEQVLGSLHSEPSVMAAALYDKNGRLFARYGRDGRARTHPTTVRTENHAFGEGYLEQTVAVREQRDQNLGFLYLRSDLRTIYDRLWRYVEIAAAIMVVSLLAAYLLAHLLQQRIARPLRALVDTARAISERSDFSGRAPPAEEGEFKLLTDAFNQMLNRLQAQLARLDLLQRTTRAISERQDLHSIFQVILRKLEDQMPVEFGCVALYDASSRTLTVRSVGTRSNPYSPQAGIAPDAILPLEAGLERISEGVLIHEPDIANISNPLLAKLASTGLRALVIAPMVVEKALFGVLIVARREPASFSSTDCEFLRQLSEHVALAAHQIQLYTDLQRAYDDLRLSQQTILQQERLRALGQMASGVAHDINNAISPVTLYTESLLEREPNLSERAREYLRIIQRAISDVGHTVARMREFYRQRDQQVDLLPVDINALVQQALTLTRARWSDMPQERGIVITVRTELAMGLPKMLGIESDLRDALTNLIFNAVDAMPDGGTLTLRTQAVADRTAGTQAIRLEVSDTGVGMDESTRRRCLEPFFTTKGERGSGMGLAMVYGMAERHGTQLEIESAPGLGTTIRLQFAVAAANTAGEVHRRQPPAPTRKLKLLVVDDDPLLSEALLRILEGEGHDVAVAEGGQEGIDLFTAAHGERREFDVVMTDLGMPYVDGRAVASAVKHLSPQTPVLLLTGWGQRFSTEQSVPEHVDALLGKPPQIAELRQVLSELTARSHFTAET